MVTADVSDDADVERLRVEAGPVDILVNNAAADEQHAAVAAADIAARNTIFDVNVLAAVRLITAFAPGMSERGYGVVVNMSSIGGSQPAPFLAAYSAIASSYVAST